jgi:hypothetical protein
MVGCRSARSVSMAIKSGQITVLLAAFLVLELGAYAQQSAESTQGTPQRPAPDSSPAKQPADATPPDSDDALEVPVLEEMDEQHVTYIESHLAVEYNHDQFEVGSNLNQVALHWLQAFGPSDRLAAGIEIPFLNFNGEGVQPDAGGIGDIEVEFRGMLTKGEKFEQAAGIVLAVPSASNNLIGDSVGDLLGTGQTVLRLEWGFSVQVTPHTLLSGEVAYNKAVQTRRSEPDVNNIETQLIVSQALGKRFGASVEWTGYYEFHDSEYVETLKPELQVELDRKQKWSIAPYAVFALGPISQAAEFKYSVGCDLIYTF